MFLNKAKPFIKVCVRRLFTVALPLLLIGGPMAYAAGECAAGEKDLFAGRYSEAAALTSQCLSDAKLNDQNKVRALQVRAWAYFNLRKDSLAVADQEESFKIKAPTDYREFINYSSYLRRVKRYQDSLKTLHSAEAIERKKGQESMMTQYNIGWTLAELGQHEEAVKAFSTGIPMQPDYPYVYWRRGLAHEAIGRRDDAARDFEMAAKLISQSRKKWTEEEFLSKMRPKFKEYGIDKKYSI